MKFQQMICPAPDCARTADGIEQSSSVCKWMKRPLWIQGISE